MLHSWPHPIGHAIRIHVIFFWVLSGTYHFSLSQMLTPQLHMFLTMVLPCFFCRDFTYHPAFNGAAENAVRIFKSFLTKTNNFNMHNIDIHVLQRFVLSYNSTQHCSMGQSGRLVHYGGKSGHNPN